MSSKNCNQCQVDMSQADAHKETQMREGRRQPKGQRAIGGKIEGKIGGKIAKKSTFS